MSKRRKSYQSKGSKLQKQNCTRSKQGWMDKFILSFSPFWFFICLFSPLCPPPVYPFTSCISARSPSVQKPHSRREPRKGASPKMAVGTKGSDVSSSSSSRGGQEEEEEERKKMSEGNIERKEPENGPNMQNMRQ